MSPRSPNRLFRKYVAYLILLVGCTLLASAATGLYSLYRETHAALSALQREKALGAALRIEQFVEEIERQIGWTVLARTGGGDNRDERHLELLKLLRRVPAITGASWLDGSGRERLRASRLRMDPIATDVDRSDDAAFREPKPGRPYFGPVYFHSATEPSMTIAVASDSQDEGVALAEVDLKPVWDAISRIRIGESGRSYVVDRRGRLLAHPDIGLALQKSDFSELPQVRHALESFDTRPEDGWEAPGTGRDPRGTPVLAAHAAVADLGWVVLVEQPIAEAYAPLYASMLRTGVLLLVALGLAVLASLALARRMTMPIRALQQGAALMGAGALHHRVEVKTGDELEALAGELNRMAARLRASYGDLERKVAARTRELERANQTRSHFLRAASHDLRQPMHALGLFIAQLSERIRDPETRRIAKQAESAVTALDQLLDAILDISRLDAGTISPEVSDFCIGLMLERLHIAFGPSAAEKGLRLRIVPSRLFVRSDPVLLERILLNLAANAVRYTQRGGIGIGCRRRGDRVRILVCDTGTGIAAERQEAIFREFYQIPNAERDSRQGLGLGLAIAADLARLLGCRIEVDSRPGKGSVFAIEVPRGQHPTMPVHSAPDPSAKDSLRGAVVLVVDDDPLVRDAMQGLLSQWGCETRVAANGDEAVTALKGLARLPDAVLCDFRLPAQGSGIQVIGRLRAIAARALPAALVTGDTSPESLHEAKASGYPVLTKPVAPAKLRALMEHLVSTSKA